MPVATFWISPLCRGPQVAQIRRHVGSLWSPRNDMKSRSHPHFTNAAVSLRLADSGSGTVATRPGTYRMACRTTSFLSIVAEALRGAIALATCHRPTHSWHYSSRFLTCRSFPLSSHAASLFTWVVVTFVLCHISSSLWALKLDSYPLSSPWRYSHPQSQVRAPRCASLC